MDPSLDQDFENQPTTREERLLDNYVGLRIVGWLFLLGGAMCSVFVWTGLRTGSNLWMWLTGGAVAIGLICVSVGHYFKMEAVEEVSERSDHLRAA